MQTLPLFTGTINGNTTFISPEFDTPDIFGYVIVPTSPVNSLDVTVEFQLEVDGTFKTVRTLNQLAIFNQVYAVPANTTRLAADARMRIHSIFTVDVEIILLYDTVSNTPALNMYELGDLIYTAKQLTSLTERSRMLWLPLRGGTIGRSISLASFPDNRLRELYNLLWNFPNIIATPAKGTTANADWTANKVLTLPDMRNRVSAMYDLSTQGMAETGTLQHTLTIEQMPRHTHATYNPDPLNFADVSPTSDGVGLNVNTLSNNARLTTPTGGQGISGATQSFSIVQPTGFIIGTALICAGEI